MGYIITTDLLGKLFPATPAATRSIWVEPLRAACRAYDILTPKRIAAFLSQIGHECAGFTRLSENLNYSAQGLMKTWPKRFPTLAAAQPYARNPEKIANKVYAGRMGNGDEASGDGWRYRGAGPIQLTGKDNHAAFAKAVGKPLAAIPDYLRTPEGGALSAAWFWSTKGLNSLCETGTVAQVTKVVNGGVLGLAERNKLFAEACVACGVAMA